MLRVSANCERVLKRHNINWRAWFGVLFEDVSEFNVGIY